ncbi:hypothetical protein ONE63_002187 [Megalurothrips usitatus]|uniref:Uncharacterized protein n=1 Tax=Megalurothrips usitatus TaxID=439358 RepID=A0AAV7XEQ7_9NEOP|nr:hypothetical protein ONE63_002187 [Megalurothrips usitatus]
MGLLLRALCVLAAHWHAAAAFNLETRLPIVKVGNRGAYFGYSVAQHQSVDDVNNAIENNWCVERRALRS